MKQPSLPRSARSIFLIIAILAASAVVNAATDVTIQNTTYSSGTIVTTTATNTITASTAVTVASGADVSFYAGTRVTLSPGFTASSGSAMRIGIDSDGDGMPDWWEAEHGVSSATANADGDGLNNLTEFLLGTDPNSTTPNTADGNLVIHRPAE